MKIVYRTVMIFFLFFASLAFAGTLEKEVRFGMDDLSFTKHRGYDVVRLKGYETTREVGAPSLPRAALSLLIPQGSEVVKVEVISMDKEVIPGKYEVYPTQHPQPILRGKVFPVVEPNKEIYSQTTPYPERIIVSPHTGSMGGYRIAGLLIYPVQYIPKDKKLIFYSRIKFKITYEENVHLVPKKTRKQKDIFKERVKKLILNPEDIERWSPPLGIGGRLLPPDTVEYVIITADSFEITFQELADWKTKKGVPAKVVTLDSIYANYSGVDNAERVRNFIIDANSSWGTIWVLLGGQCDYEWGQGVVPRRNVWYRTEDGDENDTIPSDLYFSDLDGSWDADGDNVYGESVDGVDFYSDVFVGRAPVRTTTQAEAFVNKVFTYEKTPPLSYQKKILLPAAYLWPGSYDERLSQEAIANIVPPDWQVSRLYERDGNLTHEAFVDSVQSGFGFAHLVGHGNQYGIYTYYADAYLNSNDLDTLNNNGLLGVHNSIGCMCGALDFVPGGDCFAEHYLTTTAGGSYSIMNSRYGWGMPPQMGPSEHIDTCFYHEIFTEDYPYHDHLGVAHAFAKDGYVSQVNWISVWAWCIYELNLFGDPELPLWTDIPEELTVTHDPIIPVGGTSFTVNVTYGGVGVENALLCLYKEGEVYERGYTDASGNVTLTLSPPPVSLGTMYCTVTKHNYLPYEGSVDVISPSGPWMVFDHYTVIDTPGDNDGMVDPGESIELPVVIHNVGLETGYSIAGILQTTDPYITITDSVEEFGDIPPDSFSTSLEDFDFDVSPDCPNNHTIFFDLVMSDINDSTWVSTFSIPVPTPTMEFYSYIIDDDDSGESEGNNDGIVNPGETTELPVALKNSGPVVAVGVTSVISTNDSYITLIDSTEDFGNVPSGDTATCFDDFVFYVDPACPREHEVTFYLNISDDDPATHDWQDSLEIKVWYPGDIMIVAKDPSYTDYFTRTLDSLGYTYDVYSGVELPENLPKGSALDDSFKVTVIADTSIMKQYPTIIWLTGDLWVGTVTPSEQTALEWYLNSGRSLFITGQDIGYDLVESGNGVSFYHDYLHANYIQDWVDIYSLDGVPGDLIGDGLTIYISGGDGADNQSYQSEIDTLKGSTRVFKYSADGYGAVKYEGGYRVAYFSFGYEAINSFTDRSTVMERVLDWFKGGPSISDVYTIPSEYAQPDSEIIIRATVKDPQEVLSVIAEIESPDEVFQDSVFLYDDGAHNDSLAGDNIYGNTWITLPTPLEYVVDIIAMNNELDVSVEDNATWFTTFSPPIITVSPDSMSDTLFTGQSAIHILTIGNIGGSDLVFDIMIEYMTKKTASAFSKTAFEVREFVNGQPERPATNAETDFTCTPEFAKRVYKSSVSNPQFENILILEDDCGSGFNYHYDNALDSLGLSRTLITSWGTFESELTSGTPWDLVIVSSYGNIPATSVLDALNSYQADGGLVIYAHWGVYSYSTHPLLESFGISFVSNFNTPIGFHAVDNTHPVFNNPNDISDFYWTDDGCDMDGQIVDVLPGATQLAFFDGYPTKGAIVLNVEENCIFNAFQATNFNGDDDFDGKLDIVELIENEITLLSGVTDWLSVEPTSGTVLPGSSMDIVVTFDATDLNEDDYFADIFIVSNDLDEPEVTVPAYLHVMPSAPDIAISEDTLDYGIVFIGDSVTDTLIVSNEGTELLTVSDISSDNSDYTVDTTSFALAPSESQGVLVTFTPSTEGESLGTLTIESDDPDEPTVTVALVGEGVVTPSITVNPDYMSDTLFTDESAVHILTIGNIGGSDLVFEIRDESSKGVALELSSKKIPIVPTHISPDADKTIRMSLLNQHVKRSSQKSIESSENLKLNRGNHTPAGNPPPVAGTYTGDYLHFGLSDYGEIMPFQYPVGTEHLQVGSLYSGYTVCYNNGTDHVEWAGYETRSGIVPVSYTEVVNNPDEAVIDVVTQTSEGELTITQRFTFDKHDKFIKIETDIENTGGGSLNDIVFKKWADWDIDNDFDDDNWDYDLTHNMIYVWDIHYGAIAGETPPDYRDIDGWDDCDRRLTNEDYPNDPLIDFDGLEILHYELGTLSLVEERSLTFAYGSADDLSGLQVVMERAIAGIGWLYAYPDTGRVSPNDSMEIEVTFDATGLYGGDYFANILIASNDPATPEDTVPCFLHVIGIRMPDIYLSTDTLNFDTVSVGYSDTLELQVYNIGTDTLLVSDIASDNADYSMDITNFGLPPDESLMVLVTFTPSSEGISTGNLIVESNDPDEPTVTVALIGEGMSGIEEREIDIPKVFSVSQNYPNPFSQQTVINYACPHLSKVTLKIYNITGRLVRTLLNKKINAGYHSVSWNGKDKSGKKVASGLYFYRLQAEDYTATRKMILIQ